MATDQQFCLRWNNHQSTLISVFDSLLENGTLVDCTLAAEGQYLKAHKVVLSACSPYLETLLSQHYEKHPIVILKDVKFSELKSMMDYMYRGEVNISQDQLGTFLKAAESLQIKGLSDNGDDARDVGSTAKKPDAPRPSVTQTRAPVESKRPAPVGDLSDTSRDGSISPSSLRKRRRTRRPSQGDDPDSNLDNNVCDLPAAQSTPMSVPSAAPVQSLPKQIVKTEPPPPMPDPVKKEILDPPAEPLLEPKTEYLDYMNNENSIEVEDLTLDDDDEEGLDSSMDASRPGPSHGDLSQQGGYPPWTMTGDQSGTDEIFMAAQEAVGAATGQQQRDSQGESSWNQQNAAKFDSEDLDDEIQIIEDDSVVYVEHGVKSVPNFFTDVNEETAENLKSCGNRLRPKNFKVDVVSNMNAVPNLFEDLIAEEERKCSSCGVVASCGYFTHRPTCPTVVSVGGKSFECCLCGANFNSHTMVLNHVEHSCPMNPELKSLPILSCENCNSYFDSKKSLRHHLCYCRRISSMDRKKIEVNRRKDVNCAGLLNQGFVEKLKSYAYKSCSESAQSTVGKKVIQMSTFSRGKTNVNNGGKSCETPQIMKATCSSLLLGKEAEIKFITKVTSANKPKPEFKRKLIILDVNKSTEQCKKHGLLKSLGLMPVTKLNLDSSISIQEPATDIVGSCETLHEANQEKNVGVAFQRNRKPAKKIHHKGKK